MAVEIQIKRSSGSAKPNTLKLGELAYTYGTGTQINNGDRMFIGIGGVDGNGDANEIATIGGQYFSDKLDHVDGTLTASSALTADSSSRIDTIKIGNNATAGGILELRESTNNGNNYIRIAAPNAVTNNTTFTLPDGDGNNGQFLKTNGAGQLDFATVVSTLTLKADNGSDDVISTGEDLTFTGGEGIDTTVSNNTITIAGEDATTGNKGIASFSDEDFVVSSGAVSLATIPSTFNQLNIDNIRLDGNTISTTAGGDLILDPEGSNDIDANSHKIINVTDPTAAQDAATKAYVDATVNGLDVKGSVVAASTGNASFTGAFRAGDSLDGIVLTAGDRILIKDQTTGSQNGIYTVNPTGAPTRAADFDSSSDASPGSFVFVEQGATNGDNGFVLTNNSVTLGSTALVFVQFSGAGQITAGDGIQKSGNEISVDLKANSGLEIDGGEIRINLGASAIHGTLGVGDGGTGETTFVANRILIGNGTSALNQVAIGNSGEFLISGGSGSAPSFTDTIDGGTYS